MVPDSQETIDVFILFHLSCGFLIGLVLRPYRYMPVGWFIALVLHQAFELWENDPGPCGGRWFFSLPWLTDLAHKVGLGWDGYTGDSAQNSACDTLGFVSGLFLSTLVS